MLYTIYYTLCTIYFTILYYTRITCTIINHHSCNMLDLTLRHYITLHYITLHYITLHYAIA